MPGSGAGYYARDMVVWDDGGGSALYVGGAFLYAGGKEVNYIARWDGKSWADLAGGLNGDPAVMTVFDDGNGAALIVAGGFGMAGGVPVDHIAKWNGSSWSALGSGYCCDASMALTVFDDGGGSALFALQSSGVKKWDGDRWILLPQIPGATSLRAMAAYNDGSGMKLCVGGRTKTSPAAPYVVAWDGQAWKPLGSPIGVTFGAVYAMAAFDDGQGEKLFIGGTFDNGNTPGVAVLSGKVWTKPDAGLSKQLIGHDFAVVGSGPAAALYVCGGLAAARWKGGSWETLEAVGSGDPIAGAGFDDGNGARLHVGGSLMLGAQTGNWTNIARLKSTTGGNRTCGDLNGDGVVNQRDLGVLLGDFGCTKGVGLCPGDCDLDGDTDQADLGILLANWEKACP